MNHNYFMKRALELAGKAVNYVSPNPAVGAVLVRDNRIIGEGYHRGPGSRHGEIDAMENCREPLKGAVLYTTLEPCCKDYPGKRQPPCTERIIAEGISRVVVATEDPNPHVRGHGIELLRKAGIAVETGIQEAEAKELIEVFTVNQLEKRPFVHLKMAQTLDGRIATVSGDSKWITDESAREDVHRLRARYDSVMAGSTTIKADNPLLTVRGEETKNIRRIILSGSLNLTTGYQVFEDQLNNKTTVITSNAADKKKIESFEDMGIEVIQLPAGDDGLISPRQVTHALFQSGIRSLFVEGGSEVITGFLKAGVFDKVTIYTAPIITGKGLEAIGDLQTERMSDSLHLSGIQIRRIGNQTVTMGYRSKDVYRDR